jgi:hypothetical protein
LETRAADAQQRFTWEGRRAQLRPADAGTGQTVLAIEIDPGLAPFPLARFRLVDEQEQPLAEGLVGQVSGPSGLFHGETLFDTFMQGWTGGEPLRLWLCGQAVEALSWQDYDLIERSRQAARQPFREPLDRALGWVRHFWQEWLPASAYGVPAAESVTAVLPTADSALEAALEVVLRESIAQLGLEKTNRKIMDGAKERLVGRARLSPADQLRLLEAGARKLELLFEEIARQTAPGGYPLPAAVGPTSVGSCTKFPQVVQARLEKLRALDRSDSDDRLAARIYRLTEFAGLQPDQIDAEILAELGLAREEMQVGREYALRVIHES